MIVTPEEANKLLCPHLPRQPVTVKLEDGNSRIIDNFSSCGGPMCMMWRWQNEPNRMGFCGLAGG